jgi:hypothetical protein
MPASAWLTAVLFVVAVLGVPVLFAFWPGLYDPRQDDPPDTGDGEERDGRRADSALAA